MTLESEGIEAVRGLIYWLLQCRSGNSSRDQVDSQHHILDSEEDVIVTVTEDSAASWKPQQSRK